MPPEVIVVYGWGPEEDGRLSSLLYIAETAAAMGMHISIFLFTDAAILAKKGNVAKIGGGIASRFRSVIGRDEVNFYVCEEAARKRGVDVENLEDNITIIGYSTFLDMAVAAETVITI